MKNLQAYILNLTVQGIWIPLPYGAIYGYQGYGCRFISTVQATEENYVTWLMYRYKNNDLVSLVRPLPSVRLVD
jgi:hypothetical protein